MMMMSHIVQIQNTKMSHKRFRAFLKKYRRKRKRQALAREREKNGAGNDDINQESPQASVANNSIDAAGEGNLRWIVDEEERRIQHRLWLERELKAQIEFKRKKKLEAESERIRRELEEQIDADRSREDREKAKAKAKKAKEAIQFEDIVTESTKKSRSDGPLHNPEPPKNYGTELDDENCSFFFKTGACRFGDRCSRIHLKPPESVTLLIPGMYSHFSIAESYHDEYDTDIGLEYEDSETYQHFREFYEDTVPEFKKIGHVVQFKICCNHEPHLRGNVYVQYKKQKHAVEAYKTFNGRWYAGKQLSCEFTAVTKWRHAICGQFAQKRCRKGKGCNFLHVFSNPRNEFRDADFDRSPPRENGRSNRSNRHMHSSVEHRYSRSRSRSRSRSVRSSRRSSSRSHDSHNRHSKKHRTKSRRSRSSSFDESSDADSYESSPRHNKKKSKKKKKHKKKTDNDRTPGKKE